MQAYRIVAAYAVTARQQAAHLNHLATEHRRDDKVPHRGFRKRALAAALLFLLPGQQADLEPVRPLALQGIRKATLQKISGAG